MVDTVLTGVNGDVAVQVSVTWCAEYDTPNKECDWFRDAECAKIGEPYRRHY